MSDLEYKQLLARYGEDKQTLKAIHSLDLLSERLSVFHHTDRAGKNAVKTSLIREIANAEIMIKQMKIMLNIDASSDRNGVLGIEKRKIIKDEFKRAGIKK